MKCDWCVCGRVTFELQSLFFFPPVFLSFPSFLLLLALVAVRARACSAQRCSATCRTAVREQPAVLECAEVERLVFYYLIFILFAQPERETEGYTTDAGAQVYSACVHVQMGNLDGAFYAPPPLHHLSDVRRGDKISGCGSDACSPHPPPLIRPHLLLFVLPASCVCLWRCHTHTHTSRRCAFLFLRVIFQPRSPVPSVTLSPSVIYFIHQP